jgi:hypothetical protein
MVAGIPRALAAAEREVGLDSWSVSFYPNAAGEHADETVFDRTMSPLQREARRWRLVRRALNDFDVVHFNFGLSLMPSSHSTANGGIRRSLYGLYARGFEFRDLAWLKRRGKAIVVSFLGDDARQVDVSRTIFDITHAAGAPTHDDDRKRRAIAAFARTADRIFAVNPDLLHFLPDRAEFLPYAAVDLRAWKVLETSNEVPRVVHAPSDRAVKGTRFVLEAVQQLQSDGVRFEFELVEGRTRSEARHAYERADLLVDQLLAGWYGTLAVELMALGKPVVAFVRQGDLHYIPPQMRDDLPIVSAMPESIYDVLKHLLTERRAELPELGRRSRDYVERWHDPLTIAARLKADYESIAQR